MYRTYILYSFNIKKARAYQMDEEARKARARARKKYREKHREEINAYRRKWAKENPDKVKEQASRYWKRQAELEADQADLEKGWNRQALKLGLEEN